MGVQPPISVSSQGETAVASAPFRSDWRQRGSEAFELFGNSTARRMVRLDLWGQPAQIYANANLSIYSGQTCNASCAFCVEELRPISRGRALVRHVEADASRYFHRLDATLHALIPLSPSVAITGGEPSRDPRLPGILQVMGQHPLRKKTLTTNASGLWHEYGGRSVLRHLLDAGLHHLNISRAHADPSRNNALMAMRDGLDEQKLARAIHIAESEGLPVRLSCVLLREGVGTVDGVLKYLRFARDIGVQSVIFRQLMRPDPSTTQPVGVARYCARQRVDMRPLLEQLTARDGVTFVRQVMGYYYYVEVWRVPVGDALMTVTFESADLRHLEQQKRKHPERIHELVFHPDAQLCSTWQPWDGRLGPPTAVTELPQRDADHDHDPSLKA